MLPISELRGAMPLAIVYYHLPFWTAFSFSVLGNILAGIFAVVFLNLLSDYLMHKNYWFNRFFSWLFARTRTKHGRHFEVWGRLALILFVAIPLPLTGAWSGAAAAFVFGIPPKEAAISIIAGVLISGLIMGGLVLGLINIPFASFSSFLKV
ncbi:MAG: hypothetical protein UV40_C0022G0003 [Parcubacteria group bacterium GW2011_GWA1_42_7]|nr:MAG: hypothetical protein UV40_C0022G0003 [Parcubacteria group bacterium GW2011_GWA1_42_7]KKS91716.1 MAG: hypothetical protein UV67_C0021G0003 [Parcubacteria group bacterium GW2011_GWC1_43_12]